MPTDEHTQRCLPKWKKLLYGLCTTVLFFATLEGSLAVLGVRPLGVADDPYVEFADNRPVYVQRTKLGEEPVITTSPRKLAFFNPQQFSAEKERGVFRIFCLGGSTTYGRPYDDRTSYCAWLRELLPAVAPERKWEVINAGGISHASYRLAALAGELARYEPDLLIVYTGHNEFLEHRTYGASRKASALPRRLGAIVGATRTGALLHTILSPATTETGARYRLPGDVEAILDHTVGPTSYHRDDRLRRQIVNHFELNLGRIIDLARSYGAEVLLVKPAANLKDCAPFKSAHSPDIASEQLLRWREHYQRGRRLEDQQPGEALAHYEAARRIDDRYAELHYRLGKVLLATNQASAAQAAFERAVDEDICPLRALPEMTEIVDRVAADRDIQVVDFPALLASTCVREHGRNVVGSEYFLDHVHPRIAAHRLLATALLRHLGELRILDLDAQPTGEQLGEVATRIRARLDPQTQAQALRNLARVLYWAGKVDEAGPLALAALRSAPDDPDALYIAGVYQKQAGKLRVAIRQLRAALEQHHDFAAGHWELAEALHAQGEYLDAHRHFCEVLRLEPSNVDAHLLAGEMFALEDRPAEAIEHYRAGLRLAPDDARLQEHLAEAKIQLE